MADLTEYDVVQNSALSGLALWTFVSNFYENTSKTRGPHLWFTMPILPLVFHQDTMESMRTRNLEGGLYKVIAEERGIFVGLQERMMAMSGQTFDGLNMACAAKLLRYDAVSAQFTPLRISPPQFASGDTTKIIAASKRLGYWFATTNRDQLLSLLKLRF